MPSTERLLSFIALAPASQAGEQDAVNGPSFDTHDPLNGNPNEVAVVVVTGDGTAPVTPKLQHSDDGNTWSDAVTGSQMSANAVQELRVRSPKRYVRLQIATGGATTEDTIVVGAVGLAGETRTIPI